MVIEAFDDGRLVERLLLAAKAYGLGSTIGALKGDDLLRPMAALAGRSGDAT